MLCWYPFQDSQEDLQTNDETKNMKTIKIEFAKNNRAGAVVSCDTLNRNIKIAIADGDYPLTGDPNEMKTTEPVIELQFHQMESVDTMIDALIRIKAAMMTPPLIA